MVSTEASFISLSPRQNQMESPSTARNAESSPIDRPTGLSNGSSHPEAPDSDPRRSDNCLYHGPTSAVYDETAASRNSGDGGLANLSLNEGSTRSHLFAETARQSMLNPTPSKETWLMGKNRAIGNAPVFCREA